MFVFFCRCVSCAVGLGTKHNSLARFDVLPDDGPLGPKHVGVLSKCSILINVKGFEVYKILEQQDTSA